MTGRRTDTWFGDRAEVQALWPCSEIGPDEHIHVNWCGGYYNHSHQDSQVPHSHPHDPGCATCRARRGS